MERLGESEWADVDEFITVLQDKVEKTKRELSSPAQTSILEGQHHQPAKWPALVAASYVGGLSLFSLGIPVLAASVAAALVALIAAIAAWPNSVGNELLGRSALDVSKYSITIGFAGVISIAVSWAYLATLAPGSLWVLAFSGFAFVLIPTAYYKFREEREFADETRSSEVYISHARRLELDNYITSIERQIGELQWAKDAYVAGGDEAKESADIMARYGFYELAGRIRDMLSRARRTTYLRSSNVDVNRLLDQIGARGLAVPYKCPSCSHALGESELRSNPWECAYCGSALYNLVDFLKGALA